MRKGMAEYLFYPGAKDKAKSSKKKYKKKYLNTWDDTAQGQLAIVDSDNNNPYKAGATKKMSKIDNQAYSGMVPIQKGTEFSEIVFTLYQKNCTSICEPGIERFATYRTKVTEVKWDGNKVDFKVPGMLTSYKCSASVTGNKIQFHALPKILRIDLNKRVALNTPYSTNVFYVKSKGGAKKRNVRAASGWRDYIRLKF